MFWTDEQINKSWRAPDKMREVRFSQLPVYEKRGGYIAQAKYDGYRLVVMGDSSQVTALSRHRKVLPVSQALLDSLLELNLPEPWMIDTEWCKMRGGQTESIVILDGLYFDGKWQGGKDLYARRETYYSLALPEGFGLPDETDTEFLRFFADQIDTTISPKENLTEGVVLKRAMAPLIGQRNDSAKNPLWTKVKWRAGQGGETVTVTKEDILALQSE